MQLIVLLLTPVILTNAADLNSLVPGNVAFSGNMYYYVKHRQQQGPYLLAPFSVQAVMGLTESGAKYVTALEIRDIVFYIHNTDDIEEAMEDALSTIPATITTTMFSDPAVAITDQFKEIECTSYLGTLKNMEFVDAEVAASNLNDWVDEQTSVIVNTLLMKSTWANPFPADRTVLSNYTYYSDSTSKPVTGSVYMMTQEPLLYNYFESTEFDATFLEVPFDDPDTTLTIVLPNAWNGLPNLESSISKVITAPKYIQRPVQFSFPRIETLDGPWSLKQTLQDNFAIRLAFSNTADFSGIAGYPGDLVVNDVLQSAFIGFNEDGFEAASEAATTIQSFPARTFEVNHPFLFYIKYKGMVLFVGRFIY
ncbi:serpin B3-like isoform X2 [Zophobas morio]|uniref:serpin B3-like isoform X2 n=1 Tax=Zophobas morio TaxID=2755281 RepID=UPI003082F067